MYLSLLTRSERENATCYPRLKHVREYNHGNLISWNFAVACWTLCTCSALVLWIVQSCWRDKVRVFTFPASWIDKRDLLNDKLFSFSWSWLPCVILRVLQFVQQSFRVFFNTELYVSYGVSIKEIVQDALPGSEPEGPQF